MIVAEKLSKTYRTPEGALRALDGVSIQAEAGEFVAVQGPSGCGKTTLLLALGGLLAPDAGTVRVDATDLGSLSANQRAGFRARNIGFVFQQFHLIPYLDVLDNVLAASLATSTPEPSARARELLDRFGLSARARHVPARLSTGERQRTALARALLNRPKVVLADEPTGNLDRENARIVLDHLREFVDAGGTALMVTHDPLAAERADRNLELHGGRVVESDQDPVSPDPGAGIDDETQ